MDEYTRRQTVVQQEPLRSMRGEVLRLHEEAVKADLAASYPFYPDRTARCEKARSAWAAHREASRQYEVAAKACLREIPVC